MFYIDIKMDGIVYHYSLSVYQVLFVDSQVKIYDKLSMLVAVFNLNDVTYCLWAEEVK